MAEANRKYETILITKPNLTEEEHAALIEKFTKLIDKNGAVESVDDWGVKKLAYPIDFINEGHYVLINFEAPAAFPAELERIYGITDGILRSIVVSKEEK
ncbi:MAG: 30S ribosomal protein S6 [Clostridia bacterium]|nr:30S ribosomal protein S6 [Clostridia bacterium]